jgi:hypothetical protein
LLTLKERFSVPKVYTKDKGQEAILRGSNNGSEREILSASPLSLLANAAVVQKNSARYKLLRIVLPGGQPSPDPYDCTSMFRPTFALASSLAQEKESPPEILAGRLLMRTFLVVSGLVLLLTVVPMLGSNSDTSAPWYKSPQLFVMTGFIANTTSGIWGPDFIVSGQWSPEKQQAALREWEKGLGREYDAERAVTSFGNAGATGVIFYDKWHDGLVNHDTGLTEFKMARDFVGETAKILHKHQMRSVIYYSVGLDNNPEPKFSDWTCLDAVGNPVGFAFHSDWKSFYSPYRRYVIDQLAEITKVYGPVDGFWLDIYGQPSQFYQATYQWGPKYSHDRFTREAFQSRYGKPIEQATNTEVEQFVTDGLHEFLVEIRKAVSAVQADVSFTWNGAGRDDIVHPRKAELLDAPMDWFSLEGHTVFNIDLASRLSHAMNRPFEVGMLLNSSWYTPMSDEAPPPIMSENEAIVAAATAWIQGANVYAAVTPGHSGIYDQNGDLRLLRAIGGWLKDNKFWLLDALPYSDIGILAGNPSPELEQIPTVDKLWRASHRTLVDLPTPYGELGSRPGLYADLGLRKLGYFTERVGSLFPGRKFDLGTYQLVVVPETALLDNRTEENMREYVRNGGTILAVGHASLFDPTGKERANFGLSDVFGVELTGTLPGYKQFVIAPESGLQSVLPLNTGALAVKATSGKVLAIWKSAGNKPAIVENRFGKGRCIYASAEETVLGQDSGVLRELVARLIGPPPVAMAGKHEYTLLMNRRGQDLLLYVLRRSTGSGTSTDFSRLHALSKTPELDSLNLRIRTSVVGHIKEVELLPTGKKLPLMRRAGTVEILVEATPSVTTLRLVREGTEGQGR